MAKLVKSVLKDFKNLCTPAHLYLVLPGQARNCSFTNSTYQNITLL